MSKLAKLIIIISASVVALTLAIVLPIVLTANAGDASVKVEFFNESGEVMFSESIEKDSALSAESAKVNGSVGEDVIIYEYYLTEDFANDPIVFPLTVSADTKLYARMARVLTSDDFSGVEDESIARETYYRYEDYIGEVISESAIVIDGMKENVYRHFALVDGVFTASDFAGLEKVRFSNNLGYFDVSVMNLLSGSAELSIEVEKKLSDTYNRALKGFDTSFGIAGSVRWATFSEMYEAVKSDPEEQIIVYYSSI